MLTVLAYDLTPHRALPEAVSFSTFSSAAVEPRFAQRSLRAESPFLCNEHNDSLAIWRLATKATIHTDEAEVHVGPTLNQSNLTVSSCSGLCATREP
jgi:hypothetical protein